MKKINDFIQSNSLDNLKRFINKTVFVVKYHKGQMIKEVDQPFHSLYIIIEGTIQVSPNSLDGKHIILEEISVGEMVGDIEYFHNHQSIQSVICKEEVILLEIPYSVIDELVASDITFLHFLCKQFASKLNNASIFHKQILLEDAKSRFSSVLLKQKTNTFKINAERLSQVIGCSSRHLRRLRSELINNGIICKVSKNEYSITKYDELVKYSKK